MEEKPIPKTIPVRQLKLKPIYSTLREQALLAAGFCILALAGYFGRLTALTQLFKKIQSPVFPEEFILMVAGSLVYLLFYKRYNYRFLTEDGLYFVRKGVATHIPWGMVKSAKVIHKSVFSYIQVDVAAEQSIMWITANTKGLLFRHDPKIVACFRRHMNVSGLDTQVYR